MPKSGGSDRETIHINHRITQSGFRGFDYARATGRRLTTYVVLHLRDDAAHHPVRTFERVRHKFRDWLAHKAKTTGHRTSPIYVYTFENPDGAVHVNWALHVPPNLAVEFERKLPVWVRRAQGPVGPHDLHVQPIREDRYKSLANYMFKGTDARFVEHFHLQRVHAPQGKVHGKRAGISQSIGRRARKTAAFHPGRRRPYQPVSRGSDVQAPP